MLSKRAIAIAAETSLRKRVSAALMAAGSAVDSYSSPGAVANAGEVDLAVLCVDSGRDSPWLADLRRRLGEGVPIVVVLPAPSLEDTVAAMRSEGVAAVLSADDLGSGELPNVAARLLFGDVFGVDKLVPWGVRVHTVFVGSYEDKTIAIRETSEFAERLGVRRKYRELIEQCLDEMLMNALYDAPADDSRRAPRGSKGGQARASMELGDRAVVEYGCDGTTFTLAVRDAFGTLERDTVVWYLDKCLHANEQIDRKEGGAGLGLYLIANASTQFFINFQPGVATEVSCRFDLTAPKVRLKALGIFEEKQDSAARIAAPAQATSAPRGLIAALATSVAVILVLTAMVAYPQLAPVPTGDVRAETVPAGADVEIDGQLASAGEGAPAVFRDLEAGRHHIITARLDGYEEEAAIVTPAEDEVTEVEIVLEPERVPVDLTSEPSGAEIFIDGELRGRTPQVLEFPAGSETEVRFERDGYAPADERVFASAEASEDAVTAILELSPGNAAVSITSQPLGATVAIDGDELADVTPIDEHLLPAGERHVIELSRPGHAPVSRELVLEDGERRELDIGLEPGGRIDVVANVGWAHLSIPQLDCDSVGGIRGCPAPAGTYRVRVRSRDPFVRKDVDISVGEGDERFSLRLGVAETEDDRYVFDVEDAEDPPTRVAFQPGAHTVNIVDRTNGERRERQIDVAAGETTVVAWE